MCGNEIWGMGMKAYSDADVGEFCELLGPPGEGQLVLFVFGAVEERVDGLIACSPGQEDGDECGSDESFEQRKGIFGGVDYGIHFG